MADGYKAGADTYAVTCPTDGQAFAIAFPYVVNECDTLADNAGNTLNSIWDPTETVDAGFDTGATITEDLLVSSAADFACSVGYTLDTTVTLICPADDGAAEFSGVICPANTCVATQVANSVAHTVAGSIAGVVGGSVVTVACAPGYHFGDDSVATATCVAATGLFNAIVCEPNSCTGGTITGYGANQVASATVNTGPILTGADITANIAAEFGWTLTGAAIAHCENDGAAEAVTYAGLSTTPICALSEAEANDHMKDKVDVNSNCPVDYDTTRYLEPGQYCERECADGYSSASESTWTKQCKCLTTTTVVSDMAGATANDCMPRMCTASVTSIANSATTIEGNTTTSVVDSAPVDVVCNTGFSGGGHVYCKPNGGNAPSWKYMNAIGEWVDGYPRCSPVQCPNAAWQSSLVNSIVVPGTDTGSCACATDYVATGGSPGTAVAVNADSTYDDACVANTCNTTLNNPVGVTWTDCDGKTSGDSCTPSKDLSTCDAVTMLWCFANGTYVADATCTLDPVPTTAPPGTSAATDPVQVSGSISLSGTYNCSNATATIAAYKADVEATFTTTLTDRTWTWSWTETTEISYTTEQWIPGTARVDVETAFETAFAVGGAANVAAADGLLACGLTAGAPEVDTPAPTTAATDPAGTNAGDTPAPDATTIDPASSVMVGLFSMVLALFVQLA